MLKNFWYGLAFSHEVTQNPTRLTVLGQHLVLYRTASGQPVCMSDLCMHRGTALSGGWTQGDCIVCPYHGWEFGPDGACVRIPANQDDVPIPKKARVDAYPTVEKYGYIWAFLGDLPEAERPSLPDLDDDFNSPNTRVIQGDYHWNVHYTRAVENSMDIAHAPWVHGGAFGNREEPQVPIFEVEKISEWGGKATVELKQPGRRGKRGIWDRIYKQGSEPRPIRTSGAFFMPNVTRLEVGLPIGKMVLIVSHLPIDEERTVSKYSLIRGFFTHPFFDKDSHKRVFKIFGEDLSVVIEQRPELLPYDLGAELHVRADRLQVHYRKLRQKCLDMGWSIDSHKIQTEMARIQAVVIPSPARREIPELEKAWVMKEVPMKEPTPKKKRMALNGEGELDADER